MSPYADGLAGTSQGQGTGQLEDEGLLSHRIELLAVSMAAEAES